VYRKISLAIAVEVRPAQHDTAGNGRFEYARAERPAFPGKQARAAHVDGDDFHWSLWDDLEMSGDADFFFGAL
jgi:hypothetical protein